MWHPDGHAKFIAGIKVRQNSLEGRCFQYAYFDRLTALSLDLDCRSRAEAGSYYATYHATWRSGTYFRN
jgi:hypothetical protein